LARPPPMRRPWAKRMACHISCFMVRTSHKRIRGYRLTFGIY
jgi:hypothetical protein